MGANPKINIESLAFGGDAVGRVDGKVVFVPLAAPGDLVEVKLVEQRRSFARGEIVRVLEPGPHRREPPCAVFGRCGGCQWQHVTHAAQLTAKRQILSSALRRSSCPPSPRPEAGEELGYRRRVRLAWRSQRGEVTLGFFARRSRQVLDVERCPLLEPSLQQALAPCRLALSEADGGGTLSLLAAGGEVHASLRVDRGEGPGPEAMLAGPLVGGVIRRRKHGGARRFGKATLDLAAAGEPPLQASSSTFAQANASEDRQLRERVARWAACAGQRVLELHAGIGNLTRALAAEAISLVAVEINAEACELLRRNLGQGSRVLERDASEALDELLAAGERFDLVLLDPPREGCSGVAERVAALGARRVLYVSCDPTTLARDLEQLAGAGFLPTRLAAHDMMPQTFHLEAVVLLEAGGQR